MIKFFLSRFIPVITIIMLIVILSSCTLTVEDQQGEKYKVNIQKIDQKKEDSSTINKNVPVIVDEEIKTIQLTDNSIRESEPKVSQDYIIWRSIETDESYNQSLYVALYNINTGLTKKLYLWDKKYIENERTSGGSIQIYKNWIAYSVGMYKVYLYDIDKDKSYLIYEEKEGVIRPRIVKYFDNGGIIIENRWADFSKIQSQLGKNNFDLFKKIPIDYIPNFYYFDGKNVYYRNIGRYDTSLDKVTGRLSLPDSPDPTYGFPIASNRVIYVDNKLKIVNFETDLVEDFKFDFDLQGVRSYESMFYDKDDNILIVPQNREVFVLYLNSGKKHKISIVEGVSTNAVDYDENTNVLTWVDIRDQYSGRYLPHTDVADIYMAKIPKN